MSMNDYIRKVHPKSAEVEHEDEHERDQTEMKLETQTHTQELEPESEQEHESKRERKREQELGLKREHRSRIKSEHEEEEHVFQEQSPQDNYPTLPSPRSPAKTPQTTQEPDPLYYAKDVTCPGPWRAYLDDTLPSWLAYMSDNDLLGKCDRR